MSLDTPTLKDCPLASTFLSHMLGHGETIDHKSSLSLSLSFPIYHQA